MPWRPRWPIGETRAVQMISIVQTPATHSSGAQQSLELVHAPQTPPALHDWFWQSAQLSQVLGNTHVPAAPSTARS